MKFIHIAFLAVGLPLLAACTYGTENKYASDTHVTKFTYTSSEKPYVELLTMIHTKSGRGGHSSLLINGSQTVMYDPAGRWYHSHAPERNDLVYGMSPHILGRYKSFHARKTHHVVSQRIYVSSATAEKAIAAAKLQGRAYDSTCAINTIAILNQLDGFKNLKSTYFPEKLMKRFGELPGAITDKYYEYDDGKN